MRDLYECILRTYALPCALRQTRLGVVGERQESTGARAPRQLRRCFQLPACKKKSSPLHKESDLVSRLENLLLSFFMLHQIGILSIYFQNSITGHQPCRSGNAVRLNLHTEIALKVHCTIKLHATTTDREPLAQNAPPPVCALHALLVHFSG